MIMMYDGNECEWTEPEISFRDLLVQSEIENTIYSITKEEVCWHVVCSKGWVVIFLCC